MNSYTVKETPQAFLVPNSVSDIDWSAGSGVGRLDSQVKGFLPDVFQGLDKSVPGWAMLT